MLIIRHDFAQRLQLCKLSTTAVTLNNKDIQIPSYIARDKTDILRALSTTVSTDHTAAHFKYQDDPYLIPTSNINKRIFALAQESGRKAAKWIKQEHADLFQVVFTFSLLKLVI